MIVLDSSFLVAYHNQREVHHGAATAVMERLTSGEWGRALLLEYVFLEVVTVLRVRRSLSLASFVGSTLLQAREVDLVPCSEFFLETLHTFRNQGDANLSFADSAIVVVARRHEPGYVATFHGDFAGLAGISVVPDPQEAVRE